MDISSIHFDFHRAFALALYDENYHVILNISHQGHWNYFLPYLKLYHPNILFPFMKGTHRLCPFNLIYKMLFLSITVSLKI